MTVIENSARIERLHCGLYDPILGVGDAQRSQLPVSAPAHGDSAVVGLGTG